jgi:hypothetical protein
MLIMQEEPEDDLLDSVPVPSTDGIPFHPIKLYSNFALPAGGGKTVIDFNAPNFDLKAMPIRMRVDDVNTKFVHVSFYCGNCSIYSLSSYSTTW